MEEKLVLAYFPLKITLWMRSLTKTGLKEKIKGREEAVLGAGSG